MLLFSLTLKFDGASPSIETLTDPDISVIWYVQTLGYKRDRVNILDGDGTFVTSNWFFSS